MKNIENTLNRYFEGTTSLDEEKDLRNFFQQQDIPKSLEKYRPIFGYFSEERNETTILETNIPLISKSRRLVFIRWMSLGIAASVLLFFGVKSLVHSPQSIVLSQSIVYIDGVKYTDMNTIQSEMLKSLDKFSVTNDEAIASQIEMLENF